MSKTQLLQLTIKNPIDSIAIFNANHGNNIPIVLVPEKRSICSCCFQVPSGAYGIIYHCGDDAYPDTLAPEGLQCCKPYWYRVAFLVTKQACTYNAQVKSCATKDNVMVDCDLTLVFAIGPKPEDVKSFVYLLGASKFNEFLGATTEENIRHLVRQTPLSEVHELRGSSSKQIADVLNTLNKDFSPFGVTFSKAAITDIVLNPELRKVLQGTTEFRTKIRQLDKEHEYNMKEIAYDFDKKMLEKIKVYDRRMQDIESEIAVALVTREKEKVNTESRRDVAKIKAQEQSIIEKLRAQAQLKVSSVKVKQENEEVLSKIKSQTEAQKTKANKEAEIRIYESKQSVKISENKANSLLIQAKSEGSVTESLKAMREHHLQMAKLEVSEQIAQNVKMAISGINGSALISAILDDEPTHIIKEKK